MESILLIIIGLISLFFYFIPAFVARNKNNAGVVFIVNLLFGWSLIGWVVALVMAMSSKEVGWEYQCKKCGLKAELPSQVTIFVCPNCKNENIIG